MNKKKLNVFLFPFQILFSRATFAILSVLIQALIILFLFACFQNYVIYFLGGIRVFSLILVIFIINRNIANEFKTSWIILILLFPTLGCLFYLFCQLEPSVKTLRNRQKKLEEENKELLKQKEEVIEIVKKENYQVYQHARWLNNVGHFPIYQAGAMKYFPLGEYFYEDLLEKIKNAKKFIFLEFFIIADDFMWNKILDLLKEKAKEGVEIRLLYDGTCSFVLLPRNYPKILKEYGIACKQFSPIIPLISTHYNNRDHRKIVVIDGEYAYTGGCNLACEYINVKSKYGHWKDNMIRMEGECIKTFTVLFLEMWNLNELNYKKENYKKYLIETEKKIEKGFVIPFGDHPFDNITFGKTTYMALLEMARESVDIVMPYFIVDQEFLNALLNTSRKGVRIRLILPGIADKPFVNFVAKTYFKELLQNNIEIFEYTPGFTHQKVMIADKETAVVGTINLDYRSLHLHFEDGVFLYKTKVIKELEEDVVDILKKSEQITEEKLKKYSKIKMLLGRIIRLFGPLL